MKANVPKSQSASSADGMTNRRTLLAFRSKSAKAKRPSICWASREVSAPPRVSALTIPWHVRQVLNPPPQRKLGIGRGSIATHFSPIPGGGGGGAEVRPSPKNLATEQETPHHVLVHNFYPLSTASSPHHRICLPDEIQIPVSCHQSCKAEVLEQEG